MKVICIVVTVLAIIALAKQSIAFESKLDESSMHNWMERSMPRIANKTLQQITLPGTHDSGSYTVTDELCDVPDTIDILIKVADILGLPGKISFRTKKNKLKKN